jgi:hypothetical protein
MVERVPEIEVFVTADTGAVINLMWNGEPVEPDAVMVAEDGTIEVVIAGVTYDEHNAAITVRRVQS